MAKLHPPPSVALNTMTNLEWRDLGFHKYQMCEILGSVDTDYYPITQEEDMHNYTAGFYASGCTGSGPLYNIYLVDNRLEAAIPSGIDLVEVGDHLIIKDDTGNDTDTDDISWYRFDVERVLESFGAKSGQFTVRYVTDDNGFGAQAPCDMYLNYGTYGYGVAGSGYTAAVLRETCPAFLIGDM